MFFKLANSSISRIIPHGNAKCPFVYCRRVSLEDARGNERFQDE